MIFACSRLNKLHSKHCRYCIFLNKLCFRTANADPAVLVWIISNDYISKHCTNSVISLPKNERIGCFRGYNIAFGWQGPIIYLKDLLGILSTSTPFPRSSFVRLLYTAYSL